MRRQAESGIDVVSDGEFGKTISWSRYILERLDGSRTVRSGSGERRPRPLGPRTDIEQFPEFYAEYNATQGFEEVMRNPVCVGPISYAGHAALQRDIANVTLAVAAARAAGHDVAAFLPVVAPASVAYKRQDEYYSSEEEYVFAVAAALHEEYRSIVDAGLMLQIDDAHLPMMYDNIVDPGTPEDFRRWARLRIDALNHALEGIPAIAAAITSAGDRSTARTSATCRSARSPTSCSRSTSAVTRSRWPTRATSTSGACGRSSTCRTTRC